MSSSSEKPALSRRDLLARISLGAAGAAGVWAAPALSGFDLAHANSRPSAASRPSQPSKASKVSKVSKVSRPSKASKASTPSRASGPGRQGALDVKDTSDSRQLWQGQKPRLG